MADTYDFSSLLASEPNAKQETNQEPAQQKSSGQYDFSALLAAEPNSQQSGQGQASSNLLNAMWSQESGGRQFDANGNTIVSKAGAIGQGQIMPATAPEAAALAGLPYDPVRLRNDAEYNKALSTAYLNKQISDFGGDHAKALAAYNSGPQRLRGAIAAAEKDGRPEAWLDYMPGETRAYVPSILSKINKQQAILQQPQQQADPYTKLKPIQQTSWTDDLVRGIKHGVSVTLPKSVGDAAEFFGADGVGKALQEFAKKNDTSDVSESDYGQSQDSPWSVRGNVYEAADNSILSLFPGIAGAGIGFLLGGPGGALLGYALGSAASLPVFYGSQGQQTYEKVKKAQLEAGATPEQAETAARQAGHINGSIEAGGEMLSDAIPFAKLFKPFAGVASKAGGSVVKTMLSPSLSSAAKNVAKTVGGEVVTEMGQQAGQDYTEGAYGSGDGATWESTSKVIMPTALMSIIPGMAGAASYQAQIAAANRALSDPSTNPDVRAKIAQSVVAEAGAISPGAAQNFALYSGYQIKNNLPIEIGDDAFYAEKAKGIVPELQTEAKTAGELKPVADAAASGGVASKAALAGAQSAASQAAAQPQPEADPISDRIAEVERFVSQNGVLNTLRSIGQPNGATAKEFLEALAVAKNPNADFLHRQWALESVEDGLRWAQSGSMPGLSNDRGLSTAQQPAQPGTILATQQGGAVSTQGPSQFFDPNTVDVDATRVDNMIDGPRSIEGPRQGIGFDGRQSQAEQQAGQPTVNESLTVAHSALQKQSQPVQDVSATNLQQTVDEATQGMPRVQIPSASAADVGEAATAARRKRKAKIQQLVQAGYETVSRDGQKFILSNTKTGQQVVLDSPADAQIARAAIGDMVNQRAHTAAASPLNDRLEPTPAQIAAGNYKKSDVIDLSGMKIKIENPAGSVRRGVGADGKAWETKMAHHYGEFVGTEGADGDRLDVFIGPRPDSNKVYVIDQKNKDGSFDEHKVVFGALNEQQARDTYLANYEPGWQGLGAITEMSLDDFKSWAKSDRAKEPLMYGKEGKVFQVNDGGVPFNLMALDTSELGSASRGGKGKVISKKDADLIKSIGAIFGVNVQFFRPVTSGFNGDGFFGGGNTLFLNERTTITPLAVFGHELMHLIKERNAKAYESMAKVVAANVKDPKSYRENYYGKEYAEENGSTPLTESELEELVSDVNGDLMLRPDFWRDVFRQVEADHKGEAKSIIAQLGAMLNNAIETIINGLKGGGFNAGQFVNNAKQIREAYKDGLAEYLKTSQVGRMAQQAENLKAQQKTGKDIKRSPARAEVPSDALTVEAYHFSKEARPTLTTGAYGSGLQGSDRDEILGAKDQRLKQRLYFYVNKGTGVRPESGVGGIAHKATLDGIYDADADTKRLKQGKSKRDFESAVLDAGYKGYLSRLEGSQPSQVILLGSQTVQPEVLGGRTQIPEAKVVPAPAQRDMDLGDKIMANKQLPAGQMDLPMWSRMFMALMPDAHAELNEAGFFSGDEGKKFYKDELVARLRNAQPEIKKSTARAKQEYDEVVAKYKDTDEWMKAPNGNASNLNERQWVQVRTPSFKTWFGDWESYARAGKTVWEDDKVSKVVDSNGEPLVVYHGSDEAGFSKFQAPSGRNRGDLGIFATDSWDMASSYVRRNRVQEISFPDDKKAAEDAGVEFYDYMGRVSSKQPEDQKLFGYRTPYGDEIDGFVSMEDAVADAANEYTDSSDYEKQPGVYALFLNIKNPNEDNFEGAMWNGQREDQYQVLDEDGEQVYNENGRGYFDRETANRLAEERPGSEVVEADSHHQTTDDVVKDAWRYGNDGAIIHEVVDDGGGPSAYAFEPSTVYVALKPEQVKSADFNGGEFNAESRDIRKSKTRDTDPAIGDKTDVSRLPAGKPIPESVAIGSLEKSLEMARAKSYRRGRDLNQDIQQRVLAAARAAKTNLSKRTKELHKFLASMIVSDAEYALKSNENAVGWYDQKVSRALGALSTIHPEIDEDPRSRLAFLWALATTSNGLKVDKNFELAEKAYSEWKRTGKMPTKYGIGNAAQAINKGLAYYNELAPKIGDERLLKFMSTQFTVGEINRMLGVTPGGEWMGTPVRGAAILGPKIGNGFFSNLNGYFDALTMDRWLMRTWGRMTGTLIDFDPKAIAKSRSKLAGAVASMTAMERKQFGELIGARIPPKPTKAQLDAIAKASQKASMKKDKRDVMMSSDAMNEMRKAANLHHMTLDGQKEAPSGPAERNWIRAVFQTALEQLRANGKDMTMSDLQALLWYPERRLYDAAKSDDDVSDGYEDDEAPDYANAGMNLAIERGVSRTSVMAAMDAAESRGTVQGEQLSEKEKIAMLEEFRSQPKQTNNIVFEIAPDPDNKDLTDQWNELPIKDRADVTKLVKDAVLSDVVSLMGLKIGKAVGAVGGFEGNINPNMIAEYKPGEVSIDQARALSAGIGLALDQKSVVLADQRLTDVNDLIRVSLSVDSKKVAEKMLRAINTAIPEINDFTARGKNFDVLNFTNLSTESLADKIDDALAELLDGNGIEYQIAYGPIKSTLIEKADYASEIQRVRPGSEREILQGLEGVRDRSREIVAAELGRRRSAVEVPESAGVARQPASRPDIKQSPARDRSGWSGSRQEADGRLEASERAAAQEGLSPLPGAPAIKGATGPDAKLVSVAEKYARDNGITLRRQAEYVKVDPARAKRIADAYEAMPHDPQNPRVKEAYQNLVQQTRAQYDALVDAGYKFWFMDMERSDNQEYASTPWNAMRDLRANQQMGVFPTADGFGTKEDFDPESNPLLEDTGLRWPVGSASARRTAPVLANDLFRAVHDAFGHGLEGAGFRAEGEENAWQAHVRLFTGSAIGAITTETRGQNSWLNYGPYGEKNRTAKVEDTVFADQKTGLLPEWAWKDGVVGDMPSTKSDAYNERISSLEELMSCLRK